MNQLNDVTEALADLRCLYAGREMDLRRSLAEMTEQRDFLRGEISALIDRNIMLVAQRDNLQNQSSLGTLKEREFAGRIRQLEDSLAVITNQREGELKERDELRDEVTYLRDERGELIAERDEARKNYAAATNAAIAHAKRCNDLHDRNTELIGERDRRAAGEASLYLELQATCKAAAEALEPFSVDPFSLHGLEDYEHIVLTPKAAEVARVSDLRQSLLSRFED